MSRSRLLMESKENIWHDGKTPPFDRPWNGFVITKGVSLVASLVATIRSSDPSI